MITNHPMRVDVEDNFFLTIGNCSIVRSEINVFN